MPLIFFFSLTDDRVQTNLGASEIQACVKDLGPALDLLQHTGVPLREHSLGLFVAAEEAFDFRAGGLLYGDVDDGLGRFSHGCCKCGRRGGRDSGNKGCERSVLVR